MNARIDEALRALPPLAPPPDAWARIAARADGARALKPHRWWPLALAAGAAWLALVLWPATSRPPASPPPEPQPMTVRVAAQGGGDQVTQLQARSRALERMLHGLPARPRVVPVETAGMIADLQTRIAHLDHHMSASPALVQSPPADLWRQRVDLMGRLVQVRYAEAGVDAY